jgi:hypothetical protein
LNSLVGRRKTGSARILTPVEIMKKKRRVRQPACQANPNLQETNPGFEEEREKKRNLICER